ncbi:prolyl oligopeptidase family serine peptidase [Agrobacterium vitis]|nr:prolyl oligopeptidase family serine peptidase [Agrobacterium vitis]NSY24569.1 prolyl oligopeptidase family serine peptidase [Agrobacterium vitis]
MLASLPARAALPTSADPADARAPIYRTDNGPGPEYSDVAVEQSDGIDPIVTGSLKPRRLVIFLHGIRGSGSVMEAIGSSWKSILTDTTFVSPDAPFAHRAGGRQWFGVDDQVLRPDRIQAARRAFDDLISGIVKREGFENDLDKVAFVGVSQGAIMGLDAVSTGRWKIGALVSFAGLLPLPPQSQSGSGTPVLLMHGSADQTIPSAASTAASGQLKSAGYDVTLKVYPGVGHTISTEEAREAGIFLRDRLIP